VQEV